MLDNPVNAAYITGRTIAPDLDKMIGGIAEADVAVVDTAQSRVLCRTTVSAKNSKEVEFATGRGAIHGLDDLESKANQDLDKNKRAAVSEGLKELLGT
jgi:hypothetical protein